MANRYWVGGTDDWDGIAGTKWALTSGGAGGQAVPTSADDVFFDAVTGNTKTVTILTGNTGAKSITCTGFTGFLAGTAAISVSGSVTLVAGMTLTYTGVLSIIATGTITSAGKTLGPVTVNGAGITVTLGGALTLGITNTFTLTQGTINLNGFTLSTGIFNASGSGTRGITFGSANIALTSTTAATTVLNIATAINFAYTGTGGFTRVQAATATVNFGPSGAISTNAPNLTVTSGASALTISTNTSFKALTLTGSTCTASGSVNIYGALTLASGGTYTSLIPTFLATQTFSSLGKTLGGVTVNSAGITVTLGDALTVVTTGVATLVRGTINLNGFTLSTGRFSSNTSNTRAIAFGSGNIALTSTAAAAAVLDMSDATGFTYTGTSLLTRVQGATATMEFGSSGASATNVLNLSVTSGASALTFNGVSRFKSITFTGSTCTVSGTVEVYGNLTLASGGTYTGLVPTFLETATLNSLGRTLGSTTINGTGITVTLGDAATIGTTSIFNLQRGILVLNGFTLSTGLFSSSGTNAREIQFGSANIALTSTTAAATVLSAANATSFTYTGTGGFTRNMAATATVTFGTTGGTSANAPNLVVNAGGSILGITATSHFKTITFTGSTATIVGTATLYGNLTLAIGGTYSSLIIIFAASATLTSSGNQLSALTVNASGATVTCADALNASTGVTFTDGTLKLKNGVTSAVGSFVTTGTTLKYLESTTSGAQATLSDSAGTNTVTYLSIKDSNAIGGAVFDATSPTNVNAGNNTGWLFGAGGSGNFFLLF